MKLRLLLLNFLYFAFINAVLAAPPSYIQTKDGVIIFTDPGFTFSSTAVTITLNIYSGADALFNLYEGTNYNYEKGSFSVIPIKYNEVTKAITIGDRKGSFNGMPENRTFRINIITSGKTKRFDFNANCDKEISYQGKKLFIKI